MKIALLSGDYPDVISGVGDYSGLLLAEWQTAGHQPLLITTQHKDIRLPEAPTLQVRWRLRDFPGMVRFLRKHGVSIVNIQYPCSLYGKHNLAPHLFALGLRLLGFRVTVTLHEYSNIHFLRRWSEYLLMAAAQRVIFTNPQEKALALRRFPLLRATQATVIPIGANIRRVRRVPPEKPSEIIAFFGIFYPNKHMERVIDMMAAIDRAFPERFTFRFIGGVHPYYPDYYPSFRAEAERRLGRTEWHINRSLNDIAGLLEDVFCGVLYFKDGVSMRRGSFLAFVCNSIPVITNAGENSADFEALSGRGVFFTDEALQNLAGFVEQLGHPAFYAECFARLTAFSEPYRFTTIARKYIEIFTRL